MGQKFTMILESTPDSIPVFIRLRRLLKAALRSYGFRCQYINEVKGTATVAYDRRSSGRRQLVDEQGVTLKGDESKTPRVAVIIEFDRPTRIG